MKGSPAVPGGSSVSKPTWRNSYGCSATSAFFVAASIRKENSHGESTLQGLQRDQALPNV